MSRQYLPTPEQSSKGGQAAAAIRRQELKLRKSELRLAKEAQAVHVITEMMKSPVIAGVLAYGMVMGADLIGVFGKGKASNIVNDLITGMIGNVFSDIANTAEVDLLKGAIIGYIISGGNLAGLLNSTGLSPAIAAAVSKGVAVLGA